MKELLANSTLQNCKSIWQGATPNSLTPKQNEVHMLEVLKLMLFEQEIIGVMKIFKHTQHSLLIAELNLEIC